MKKKDEENGKYAYTQCREELQACQETSCQETSCQETSKDNISESGLERQIRCNCHIV